MNKVSLMLVLAFVVSVSLVTSDAYAFNPQNFTITVDDAYTTNFADYDVISIVFSLFNGGTEDAVLSSHSMLYLNDTNSDMWEYTSYTDLPNFTETQCPDLDTTISANSTGQVTLCYLTMPDDDIGYSVYLTDNDPLSGNQPKEVVLESVPDWFKTTAASWCSDSITESEFITLVETNIGDGNITVMRGQSGDDLATPTPSWVKSNACLWSTDQLSDYEFLDSIYWFIDNGKIQLN